MIRAQHLCKAFHQRVAVDDFSFEVGEGEIYGLLGPNGAGKTTTVRMLACLLRPTSGSALVAGFDTQAQPEQIRRRIGLLTEAPGLYLRLTPREYLDFFGQAYGLAGGVRTARTEELLRMVGIWDRRNEVMRGFSKGMQQRVAIARTLLHQPRVLFFDEPTAALDPEAAKTVRDHLLEIVRAEGSTVLLCTHNLAEAERLCNRLSIVHSGRQVAEGTPAELKAGVERAMRLRLSSVDERAVRVIQDEPGVRGVEARDGVVLFRTDSPERVNPRLVARLVGLGAEVVALEEEAVSLEDVYLAVVRRVGATTRPSPAARSAHPEPVEGPSTAEAWDAKRRGHAATAEAGEDGGAGRPGRSAVGGRRTGDQRCSG